MIRPIAPHVERLFQYVASSDLRAADYGLRCGSPWMASGMGLCLKPDQHGHQCSREKDHPGLCSPTIKESAEPRWEGDGRSRAERAYGREVEAEDRYLSKCDGDQRRLILKAFGGGDVKGLTLYGTYPLAVFACREAMAIYKESGGLHLEFMDGWLRELAGKRDATSRAKVKAIRIATEAALAEALRACGLEVDNPEVDDQGKPVPEEPSIPMMQLVRVLGLDRKTVQKTLRERKIGRSPHGRSLLVHTRDLAAKMPDWYARVAAA